MVCSVSTPRSSQGDNTSAENQVKHRNGTEGYLWEKNVPERGNHKLKKKKKEIPREGQWWKNGGDRQ